MFDKKYEDKLSSVLRLFILTLTMSGLVVYFKIGYDSMYFLNWMKAWLVVMIIVYPTMCFIISPFVIKKIGMRLGQKKAKMIGMLLLTLIMGIFFTYRFDTESSSLFSDILKNWLILTIIVFPFVMLVVNPILNPLVKKLIR